MDRAALDDTDLMFKRKRCGFNHLDRTFNGQEVTAMPSDIHYRAGSHRSSRRTIATPVPPEDKSFDPCLTLQRRRGLRNYETMMGRWSVLVAAPFLDWLAAPQRLDWLDGDCGNGVFSEVPMRRQRSCSVVGVDPSSARNSVGAADDGPLVLHARANAVRDRRA